MPAFLSLSFRVCFCTAAPTFALASRHLAPSGSPHRPQSHFPGLLTSRISSLVSIPPARFPHLPVLLPSVTASSPSPQSPDPHPRPHLLTCSASALLEPTGRGQRPPKPRCTPRMRCGPGRRGSVAGGVLPRPRTAPVSGAAGADQVFVSRWLPFCTPIR